MVHLLSMITNLTYQYILVTRVNNEKTNEVEVVVFCES